MATQSFSAGDLFSYPEVILAFTRLLVLMIRQVFQIMTARTGRPHGHAHTAEIPGELISSEKSAGLAPVKGHCPRGRVTRPVTPVSGSRYLRYVPTLPPSEAPRQTVRGLKPHGSYGTPVRSNLGSVLSSKATGTLPVEYP